MAKKKEIKKRTRIIVDGKEVHSYAGEKIPQGMKRLVKGHLKGIELKISWIGEEGVESHVERTA